MRSSLSSMCISSITPAAVSSTSGPSLCDVDHSACDMWSPCCAVGEQSRHVGGEGAGGGEEEDAGAAVGMRVLVGRGDGSGVEEHERTGCCGTRMEAVTALRCSSVT